MSTIVTRAGKGSPLTSTEVDSNFTNLNTDKVEKSGDTLTGDLAFGDNVKVKFGASDDLQIYHGGAHSFIDDAGTGNLYIRGSQINLSKYTGETLASFVSDGAVTLYYDNASKLATTSSGVDITGDLVADGATFEGNVTLTKSVGDTILYLESDSDNNNESDNAFIIFKADGGFENSAIWNGNKGGTNDNTLNISNATGVNGGVRFFTSSTDNGWESAPERLKINVNGDISFYEDTGTTAKLTWDASAEELQFKDNVKATFGDGNDLRIYHSGTQSYIQDQGTGNLNLLGNSVVIANYNGGENYIRCISNDAVELYYDNAKKLATTSTGIDVTGTITADGLTVDSSDATLELHDPDVANPLTISQSDSVGEINLGSAGALKIGAGNNSSDADIVFYTKTTKTNRVRIDNDGDIIFYNDTGASQDFYWDASASRLGLGTTSPGGVIHATSSGVSTFVFQGADVGEGTLFQIRNGTNNSATGNGHRLEFVHGNNNSRNVFFRTSSSGTFGRSPVLYIGSQNDTGGAELDHIQVQAGGDVIFYNDASTSQDFYWDASTSRLGLGITSPATVFEVKSAGNTAETVAQFGNLNIEGGLQIKTNGNLEWGFNALNSRSLTFSTNQTERMRIDSSGNVGIGTTSPTAKLDVEGVVRARSGPTFTDLTYYGIDFYRSFSYLRPDTNGTKTLSIGADSVSKNWQVISHGASNSHIFNIGASEAMRIDSSGNVGIGTTSPTTTLHVTGSNFPARFSDDGTGFNLDIKHDTTQGITSLEQVNSGGDIKLKAGASSGLLLFEAGGSERMRLDSLGRLGIGTISPSTALHVAGSNSPARFSDDGTGFNLDIKHDTSQGIASLEQSNSGGDIKLKAGVSSGLLLFETGGSEAARIDSSGNLLVGTTSQISSGKVSISGGTSANGITATTDATSGYSAAVFKRTASDGALITFQNDVNVDVGIISTNYNDMLIGTGDTGLYFSDSTDDIQPFNPTTTGSRDNAINLGRSNRRFKDLYLSGGVYLGGVGSSNLLDDYEEGTFTPTFGGSTTDPSGVTYDQQTGTYTKVGTLVQVTVTLGTDAITSVGSGNLRIRGLPFNPNANRGAGRPTAYSFASNIEDYNIYVGNGYFDLLKGSPFGYAQTSVLGTGTNANRLWVTFSYETT